MLIEASPPASATILMLSSFATSDFDLVFVLLFVELPEEVFYDDYFANKELF
jgi:hypothetical protein